MMESFRSGTRDICSRVSSQYPKLSSTNAYPMHVYDVKYPRFAVPLDRSNQFLPRYNQAFFPGIYRGESQLEKSARMSMCNESLSHQSLTWTFGDAGDFGANYPDPTRSFVSYGGQEPQTTTSNNADVPTKKETLKMAFDDKNEAAIKSNVNVSSAKRSKVYWERRKRNNLSAKRSRDARRLRELHAQRRVAFLEEENMRIRTELKVLEDENHRLRRVRSGHV